MEQRRRRLVGSTQAAPVISAPTTTHAQNPTHAPEVSSPTIVKLAHQLSFPSYSPIPTMESCWKLLHIGVSVCSSHVRCTNSPHGLKIRNLGNTQSRYQSDSSYQSNQNSMHKNYCQTKRVGCLVQMGGWHAEDEWSCLKSRLTFCKAFSLSSSFFTVFSRLVVVVTSSFSSWTIFFSNASTSSFA